MKINSFRPPIRLALTLALALFSFNTLAIDPNPVLDVGFGSGSRSQQGGIDSINLMTGALALNVPLGQRYSVNGGLDYGFNLIYSSNAWRFEVSTTTSGHQVVAELQEKFFDAGLGWKVAIPRLYLPDGDDATPNAPCRWLLSTWSGGTHHFDNTLNRTITTFENCPLDTPASPYFTRDGSYLRLTTTSSGGNWCTGEGCKVEYPDGRKEYFVGNEGLLSKVEDAYGNTITVTINGDTWSFSDGHRTQKLKYDTVAGCTDKQLRFVETTAFGGADADYTLEYVPKTIDIHHLNTTSGSVTSCFLHKVKLPDGQEYEFDYSTTNAGPGVSGLLKEAKLPAGGYYEYDYLGYELNSSYDPRCCTIPGNCDVCPEDFVLTSDGVKEKRQYDSPSDGNPDTWIYLQGLELVPGTNNEDYYSKLIVTSPDGNDTVNYFWLGVGKLAVWEDLWVYSLPLRLDQENGGRYLSQEIYEGSYLNPANLRRRVWLDYESDLWAFSRGNSHDFNQRLRSQSVEYLDDSSSQSITTYAQFDGLGHYRKSTATSSGVLSGATRTTETNFNPNSGTLNCSNIPNSGCTGVTPPGNGEAWLLNLFDYQTVEEGNETARRDYCFEGLLDSGGTGSDETPFLLKERIRKNTGTISHPPSTQDLIRVYTRDANGNRTVEKYYGGDTQGVSTSSNLCSVSPTNEQYRLDHSYQYGSLKTSKFTCSGAEVLSLEDNTIDASTGLASSSRDAADFQTTFEYDLMGRIEWMKPSIGGPAVVGYDYHLAYPQSVTVKNRVNNGGETGAVLTEEKHTYDGLSRRTRQASHLPSGWAYVDFEYDSMGRLWKKSEQDNTPVHDTVFDYDFLGRLEFTTLPDGKTIDFGYDGVRRKSRKVTVMTTSGLVNAITLEIYDRHGRLIEVEEDSNPDGSTAATLYEYDVLNNIDRVCIDTAGFTVSSCEYQRRTFDYDGRGFLKWADHPEANKTYYDDYDAMGHVGQRRIEGDTSNQFKLYYNYDQAGRLIQVRQGSASGPMQKEFFFDRANFNGRSKGKLVRTKRHNVLNDPQGVGSVDVVITEDFAYGELGGLLSEKTTKYSRTLLSPSAKTYTTSFQYNDLGNMTHLTYPGNPARTVTTTFNRGFPTSISDGGVTYASSITYHGNGMLNRIIHGNGYRYLQHKDDHDMKRLDGFEVQNSSGTPLAQFMPFEYDGAGNLFDVGCPLVGGTDDYRYDKVSRVVATSLCDNSTPMTYAYDVAGNMTQRTQSGGILGANFTIDFNTNRIVGPFAYSYDVAGNMISRTFSGGGDAYAWDAFNMMKEVEPEKRLYAYTADDERVLIYDDATGQESLRLRGAGNQIIREFNGFGGWQEDWIRRGGALLATVEPSPPGEDDDPPPDRVIYYHPDHLGSSRFVTYSDGTAPFQRVFRPFGLENPSTDPTEQEPVRFTGHEREFGTNASQQDNLDYMHARYYSPWLGRFLSVDPVGGKPGSPQSWNRYVYVEGNPISFFDPDGNLKARSYGDAYTIDLETNKYIIRAFYIRDRTPKAFYPRKIKDFLSRLDTARKIDQMIKGPWVETHSTLDGKFEHIDFEKAVQSEFIGIGNSVGLEFKENGIFNASDLKYLQTAVNIVAKNLYDNGKGSIDLDEYKQLLSTYNVENLLEEADEAMEKAKEKRRRIIDKIDDSLD